MSLGATSQAAVAAQQQQAQQQQQQQQQQQPAQQSPSRCSQNKSIGHYVLGKTIGEGTFGKVKLGRHILSGERVAVKILEKEKIIEVADVERIAREVHILKLIRHPHIVQLYEIIETRGQLYLIMEYASGGELFDYIVSKGRVAEPEACRFFHQIIAGVEKVHAMQVVHRDLKPENLLLDEHMCIKIVDFGLSNVFRDNQKLQTACGSPCYAPPEMVAGHAYVPTMCDLWSCGVILFALVCGYLPFEDQNTAALYQKILAADYQAPHNISPSVKELIAGLLTVDPTQRFTVARVRAHAWYRQIPEASVQPQELAQGQAGLDEDVLRELDAYGFPRDYTIRCLEMNKHNHLTTTYYLLMDKKRRVCEQIQRMEVDHSPRAAGAPQAPRAPVPPQPALEGDADASAGVHRPPAGHDRPGAQAVDVRTQPLDARGRPATPGGVPGPAGSGPVPGHSAPMSPIAATVAVSCTPPVSPPPSARSQGGQSRYSPVRESSAPQRPAPPPVTQVARQRTMPEAAARHGDLPVPRGIPVTPSIQTRESLGQRVPTVRSPVQNPGAVRQTSVPPVPLPAPAEAHAPALASRATAHTAPGHSCGHSAPGHGAPGHAAPAAAAPPFHGAQGSSALGSSALGSTALGSTATAPTGSSATAPGSAPQATRPAATGPLGVGAAIRAATGPPGVAPSGSLTARGSIGGYPRAAAVRPAVRGPQSPDLRTELRAPLSAREPRRPDLGKLPITPRCTVGGGIGSGALTHRPGVERRSTTGSTTNMSSSTKVATSSSPGPAGASIAGVSTPRPLVVPKTPGRDMTPLTARLPQTAPVSPGIASVRSISSTRVPTTPRDPNLRAAVGGSANRTWRSPIAGLSPHHSPGPCCSPGTRPQA